MTLQLLICFQGPSQWVTLEFPHRVHITQLQVQFQGGFSSRHSCLEGTGRSQEVGVKGFPGFSASFCTAGSQGGDTLSKIVDFYPEDTNALQISCLVWGVRDLVF